MPHLDEHLSQEIKNATKHLGLWRGGPEVDYTHARERYAVSITVVHVPRFDPARAGRHALTKNTPALLVQRASGHGEIGSWSGVSGYIGMVNPPPCEDPADQVDPEEHDPVYYTICAELNEECGLTPEFIKSLVLYPGERFWEPTFPGGRVHVIPVLAVYSGEWLPQITLKLDELSDYAWVSLGRIHAVSCVNAGYIKNTLPRILRAMPHT
ncbi:MAG TPA: NUDIX hydrolase [Candidatus Saccharimonadales bacterium]|nr:NUDIX hydrolase [Candidatus Saccharimonadales bacterium]